MVVATGLPPDVSRVRTWLIAVAAMLMLAVAAIWQVPQHLDWTRYRATLETLASSALSKPVSIRGPIKLGLLPQAVLTAAQVSIGSDEPGDTSIKVQALRLRVALWPLLSGRIDARELVLQAPDLHIPWPVASDLARARAPTWLAAFSARIENGRLTLGRVTFSGINATIGSDNGGALTADGNAQVNSQDWRFTVRTAPRFDDTEHLEVTLAGQGNASGISASMTGQITADGGFSGSIQGAGPNLALLLPAPAVPFNADGRLTIGSGIAAVDQLALRIGELPATGALALHVFPKPRLAITLSARRLDLDAWFPVMLAARTTIDSTDLPIGIDIAADAVSFGGGTLQHAHAKLDLTGDNIALQDASVVLPGNAMLHLSGRAAQSTSAHPGFEGDAKLQVPALRTTLGWLQAAAPHFVPSGSLPDGVLQRADVSAHVVATDQTIALRQLDGTVDGSHVGGSFQVKRGERPTIVAQLSIDRMALDPWLSALPRTKSLDAAFRVNVGEAILAGYALSNVAVDADFEGGAVALRRGQASVEGATILASGTLSAAGNLKDGLFRLDAPNASPLANILPPRWRATPALWQGPLRLAVRANGPSSALALGIGLSLGDATLDANPTVDLSRWQWNGEITLRHPGARRFASALGLSEALPWLGDGSLSLSAHLSGKQDSVLADSFNLTAAGMRLGGSLALQLTEDTPYLSGQLSADSLVLPLPSGDSAVPLPIDVLQGWQGKLAVSVGSLTLDSSGSLQDAKTTIEVANNALRIEHFTGKLDGGALTGSAVFDAAATPPSLSIRAHLDDAAVTTPIGGPVDLTSASVNGSAALSASGYSAATLLATLTGHVAISATEGTISGFDLSHMKAATQQTDPVAAEKAANDALGSGITGFDRLEISGTVAHGDVLIDSARMQGSAGEALAAGDISLPNHSLDLRITLRPAMDNPPQIAVRLSGPIDRPQRTPELASVARFVAERVH